MILLTYFIYMGANGVDVSMWVLFAGAMEGFVEAWLLLEREGM